MPLFYQDCGGTEMTMTYSSQINFLYFGSFFKQKPQMFYLQLSNYENFLSSSFFWYGTKIGSQLLLGPTKTIQKWKIDFGIYRFILAFYKANPIKRCHLEP